MNTMDMIFLIFINVCFSGICLVILTESILEAMASRIVERKKLEWRTKNTHGLSPEKTAEKLRERDKAISDLAESLFNHSGTCAKNLSVMLIDDVELCDFLLQLRQGGAVLRAVGGSWLHPVAGSIAVDKESGDINIAFNTTAKTIRKFFGLNSKGSQIVCGAVINNNGGLTDTELRIALEKNENNIQFCRTNQARLKESITELETVNTNSKDDATNSKMLGTLKASLAAEEKKERDLLARKAKLEDHIAQIAVCRDRLKKYRKAREAVIRCNGSGVEDIDKQIGSAMQTGYALQRARQEIADAGDMVAGEIELAQEYLPEIPAPTAQTADDQAEEDFAAPNGQLSTKRGASTLIVN